MPINWEEAPEGTTHHISHPNIKHRVWWIKVTGPKSYEYWDGRWRIPDVRGQSLEQLCAECGYICEEIPKEKPMFTVKDIKHTRAYEQLKVFIDLNVADAKRRPYELGVLTKRYLHGLNNGWVNDEDKLREDLDVAGSFDWAQTPERSRFWMGVNETVKLENLHPCPVGGGEVKAVAKKPQPKVPAPAKRLGWW